MVDNVKQQITIKSRKKAYSAISNGSNKKHNPGDRAPNGQKCRYHKTMHLMDLLAYKYERKLSQQQIADAIGKNKATVQGFLGKRKHNFRPMSKYDYLKMVKNIEPTEVWNKIKSEIGDIQDMHPADVSCIVLRSIR